MPNKPETHPMATIREIKLTVPDFRSLDAETWFAVLEMEFDSHGITADQDKYSQVIPRLPAETIQLVKHIILSASSKKYLKIKDITLNESRPSTRARLEQLFQTAQLGNRKPSSLLRELRQHADPAIVTESLLQEIWIQRLPNTMQGILAASTFKDLDQMAATADAIFDRTFPTVALVSAQPHPQATGSNSLTEQEQDIETLTQRLAQVKVRRRSPEPQWRQEIDNLKQDLSDIKRLLRDKPRNSSQFRDTRPQGRSYRHPEEQSSVCWFHGRFGPAATRCRPPCAYKTKRSGNE